MREDMLSTGRSLRSGRGQGALVRCVRLVDSGIQRLAGLVLVCAGVCLIVLFLLGTADIIGSRFLGQAVPSAFEFQEVLMGMAMFGAFAAIQRRRGHIVVDILSQRFGGLARKLSDLLALAAGLVVFGLLAWQAGLLALRSISILELSPGYVAFPLYPVKAFVFFCALIACLEFLRQLARRLLFWGAVYYDAPSSNEPGNNEPGRDEPGRDEPGRDERR